MAFTDQFIQNYVAYQDDYAPIHQIDPPPAANQTIAGGYDPSNASPIDRPFIATVLRAFNPDTTFASNTQLYTLYSRVPDNINRFQVNYNTVFDAWDINDQKQDIIMTFVPFNITNTTGSNLSVLGVEVHDPGQDAVAGILSNDVLKSSITLQESAPTSGLFTYKSTENITFLQGHRLSNHIYVLHTQQITDTDGAVPQKFVSGAEITPSFDDAAGEVTVFNLGKFSVSRYIFPNSIFLEPGQVFSISLGSISFSYDAEVIS